LLANALEEAQQVAVDTDDTLAVPAQVNARRGVNAKLEHHHFVVEVDFAPEIRLGLGRSSFERPSDALAGPRQSASRIERQRPGVVAQV
jgi:hypothetical protein